MRLAQFITEHSEEIVREWESFARTLVPASGKLDVAGLRDSAKEMLESIARELDQSRSKGERARMSRGEDMPAGEASTPAQLHGFGRAEHGFTLEQMVSEFRALRASVVRLWREAAPPDASSLEDLSRFDEAIDQALAESVARFRQELESSKDMFLGILGHDLRNPLGAIVMSADHLRSRGGDVEKTGGRILNSARRMKTMIDDLLDFTKSRLGTGIPISLVDLDLGEVCRQTVEEIAASRPRNSFRFDAAGDLRGRFDGARIAQALSNLVGNAVQHGGPGTPITVDVRGNANDFVVTVHNEGEPIPPSALETIFLPMRRGDASSTGGGSLGLGLYIASEIVAAHQGRIEVASSAEQGTTFTVRLPRAAAATWSAEPSGAPGAP